MHCNSKLFKVDEKIKFLERNLFDYSQLIDELAKSFYKIKFSPSKKSAQKRGQNTFQNHIKRNKGKKFLNFFQTLIMLLMVSLVF